ncbi:PAS domain S-box protein [Rhodoferax sp. 4810]|uniref:Sensory/regulatory protein RpfC n=1 Tax=Thiospirillum jenense TaxID=1653858 RepID=A0A839HDX0_9GAMM|nr:PAS domain S-box protein [Thiospirillum jenense]MBB1073197.1 PAS domain S-box protein [Rhodoferax jenense]MBB1124642.1 PAS domain S-box protein [Thiospirillum jenense]
MNQPRLLRSLWLLPSLVIIAGIALTLLSWQQFQVNEQRLVNICQVQLNAIAHQIKQPICAQPHHAVLSLLGVTDLFQQSYSLNQSLFNYTDIAESLPLITHVGIQTLDVFSNDNRNVRIPLYDVKYQANYIVVLGILITLFLAMLTWFLLRRWAFIQASIAHLQSKLAENNEHYCQIFELSSAIQLVINPQSRCIVDANSAAVAFYGYTHPQLTALTITDIILLSNDALQQQLSAVIDGTQRQFHCQHRLASGEVRQVEIYSVPIQIGNQILLHTIVHDITVRYEIEAALQASEAKLRTIFDILPIGISITDRTGKVIDCNGASEGLLGLSCTDHLQRHYDSPEWQIVRPDGSPMPPREYASVRAFIEKRPIHNVEMGIVKPNGMTWILVNAIPSTHPDYGVIITYADITAYKQTHSHLHALTERLQLATDAGGIGVWEWDIVNDRIIWDDRIYAMYGLERAEFEGTYAAWLNLLHPDDAVLFTLEQAKDFFSSQYDSCATQFRVYWPDGSIRYLATSAKILRDHNNNLQRLIGVNWDITEQQQAQLALQASEARARTIIDASPIPFVLIDVVKQTFVYLNPAFIRHFGYTETDIPTVTAWWPLAYPDPIYRQQVQETWKIRLEQTQCGQAFDPMEVNIRCKDQRQCTVIVVATPLESPFTNLFLVSLYDVTELHRARELAEQAARIKTEFLANMSHEIRTPMTAIIGLSELALHKPLAPSIRADLEKIHYAAHSLLRIINDILDYSKIESGHFYIEQQDFSLDILLENMRHLFALRAEEKGLIIQFYLTPEMPRWLKGDPLRLQQVLSNLLSNAIKFTTAGQVQLSISITASSSKQINLCFIICDTGIGMDKATVGRLFQPFMQADGSITRRFGGTGLGLAISQKLLQLMGSQLTVKSELGHGSCFSFELVFGIATSELNNQAPLSVLKQSACDTVPSNLVGKRILVAEDNLINQQVIQGILNLSGIDVDVVNNGQDALNRLELTSYDAVLMDIHMPEMDGLTATQKIRQQAAFAALPIIALTASVTLEEREQAFACGVNAILAKPINLEELHTTLQYWTMPNATDMTQPPYLSLTNIGVNQTEPPQLPFVLPGFDLRLLNQALHNPTQIIKLLQQFATTIQDIAEHIQQALAAGDRVAAQALAHRLKGVAGNVGATALYSAAMQLDLELQQLEPVSETTLAAFYRAHADTRAALEQLNTQASPSPIKLGNPAAFLELANHARQLLTARDLLTDELLTALEATVSSNDEVSYTAFKRQVQQIDYRLALATLDQLCQCAERALEK